MKKTGKETELHPMPNRIGGKLFLLGLITPRELSVALKIQRKLDTKLPLGQIILNMIRENHGDERAERVRAGLEGLLLAGRSEKPRRAKTLTASEIELLDIACNGGCPEEAKRCILQFKANPNVRSLHPAGMTPLLKACSLGHTDVALMLLRCKADVNARDLVERWTPLMHAVHTQNLILLRGILAHTPRLRVHNRCGEDALDLLLSPVGKTKAQRNIDALMALELLKTYHRSFSSDELARIKATFSENDRIIRFLETHPPDPPAKSVGMMSRIYHFLHKHP